MKFLLAPVLFALIALTGFPSQDQTQQQYARFQGIPLSERKAEYRSLTSNQKSSLWRYHLQRTIAEHPELTESQRDRLTEISTAIGAGFFESPADLGSLALFSKRLGRELFVELGGPEPIARRNHVSLSPDCSCSQQSDWCSTKCGGFTCLQADAGCGTFWAYACTGMCTGGVLPEDPPDH